MAWSSRWVDRGAVKDGRSGDDVGMEQQDAVRPRVVYGWREAAARLTEVEEEGGGAGSEGLESQARWWAQRCDRRGGWRARLVGW